MGLLVEWIIIDRNGALFPYFIPNGVIAIVRSWIINLVALLISDTIVI